MPKHRTLTVSAEQRAALLARRDHARQPYLRERAAALLKIADGLTAAQVAKQGLYRKRKPDTIYAWLDRYQEEGLSGLLIHPGRGRKAAFSPSDAGASQSRVAASVAPRAVAVRGQQGALDVERRLAAHCEDLGLQTDAGLCQVFERLGIHYKRGRDYVHSPDRQYEAKRAVVERLKHEVQDSQGLAALLFLDEITYYRQPSLAPAYEEAGEALPKALRSLRANTPTRLVGTLDAHTGCVLCQQGAKIGVEQLVAFYQQVVAAYPTAQRLWIVQDNWPVHFHPDLLVALEPQHSPFPFPRPPAWSSQPHPRARERWGHLHLPIQIVVLPTYASWCNPIEKLWRKLRQDLLHLHRLADDLSALRAHVLAYLQQFTAGSLDLLQYVGLHLPY